MRLRVDRSGRLAVALAAVAVLLFAAPPASAITIAVDAASGTDVPACGTGANSACQTIQYAITNVATGGDRIDVAAGVYAGPIVVDKQVILAGAQFGVDARSRAVPQAQESVLTGGEPGSAIVLSATGAIVDGFLVTGNASTAGMYTIATGSRYRIRNTIFADNVFGLYLNTAPGEDTVVRHNRFDANDRPGGVSGTAIYSDQGAQNVSIEENRFTTSSGASVNFAAGSLQNAVQDQLAILRNDFIGTNSMVLVGADDVLVAGNLFDGGGFDAVSVSGGSSDVEISGNTIRGKGRDGVRVRDPFGGGPNRGVRITGNSITGSGQTGIHVLPDSLLGSLVVDGNRIAGNPTGILNEDDDPLRAENDWWGCNGGPGAPGCDTVATTPAGAAVDASPWRVLTVTAAPATVGASGQLAGVTASVRKNSDGADLGEDAPFPQVPVAFAATGGSVTPSATLTGGEARATFSSGAAPGAAGVSATLDAATVGATLSVVALTGPRGQTGPQGSQGPPGSNGAQGPPGPPGATPAGRIIISYPQRGAKMSARGVVTITVRCGAASGQSCSGLLRLRQGSTLQGALLGQASFLVRGGRSTKVAVLLGASAQQRVRSRGRLASNAYATRAVAAGTVPSARSTQIDGTILAP